MLRTSGETSYEECLEKKKVDIHASVGEEKSPANTHYCQLQQNHLKVSREEWAGPTSLNGVGGAKED